MDSQFPTEVAKAPGLHQMLAIVWSRQSSADQKPYTTHVIATTTIVCAYFRLASNACKGNGGHSEDGHQGPAALDCHQQASKLSADAVYLLVCQDTSAVLNKNLACTSMAVNKHALM